MFKVFAMPPLFPAVLSIVPMWLGLMPRYDVIYIPVLTDLYIFALSYIFFVIVNAIIIAPTCIFIASRTSSTPVGVGLAFAIAILGTFVALASNRSSDAIFLLFLGLFLTAWASFYYAAKYRRSVPTRKTRQMDSSDTDR